MLQWHFLFLTSPPCHVRSRSDFLLSRALWTKNCPIPKRGGGVWENLVEDPAVWCVSNFTVIPVIWRAWCNSWLGLAPRSFSFSMCEWGLRICISRIFPVRCSLKITAQVEALCTLSDSLPAAPPISQLPTSPSWPSSCPQPNINTYLQAGRIPCSNPCSGASMWGQTEAGLPWRPHSC